MRTTALIPASGLAAILGALALAVPAQAATTVGNSLAATPSTVTLCSGNFGCTLVPSDNASASPVSGVVVRWRVKAAAAAQTSIALRIMRGNTAIARSAAQTLTAPGISTFPTRLSIQAGDRLGLDALGDNPPIAAFPGAGSLDRWDPPLAPNETRARTNQLPVTELLLNADVEADADSDGWGDETQDRCVGQAGSQEGCVPPPPPAPTTSPPQSAVFDAPSQPAGSNTAPSRPAGSTTSRPAPTTSSPAP